MRLQRFLGFRTRYLLGMNFILISIILLTIFFSFRPKRGSHSVELFVRRALQEQARSVAALFSLQLEKARLDTQTLAGLATHIFSHPESYRLSAQPGEYDYDEEIGIYGSVRNDGASVAFLSTLTPLTPALLKEIRLSEYLNPMFQTLLQLNPHYGRVSLITVDSFQRSFPWFNFKEEIISGRMKKDYQSPGLSIFGKASPTHDPQNDAVWEVTAADPPEQGSRISCAAPFFVGDQFHGVLVTEINPVPWAKRCFLDSDFRDRQALLLGSGGRVLGISLQLEKSANIDRVEETPQLLKDLKLRNVSELESILGRLPMTEAYSGRVSGDYLQVLPIGPIPARLVTLLTPEEAIEIASGEPPGRLLSQDRGTTWMALVAGLMLSLNSLWILGSQKQQRKASGDGDETHWIPLLEPIEPLDKSYPETDADPGDHQFLSHDDLESSVNAKPPPAEREALQLWIHQVAILSCFDAVGPMGLHLPRLCETLQEIFLVQQAVILLYSPDDRMFRALWGNPVIRGEGEVIHPLEIKAERFLDSSDDSRNVYFSNAPGCDPGNEEPLSQIVRRNYMIGVLPLQEKVLGGVLLVDKDTDFTTTDQTLMVELRESIALTLRNLYQCEGLQKIDELRREYCLEFSRAVETTLDRIREEVQDIYVRMGKISPPQRKHCEAILFEVGKLTEVVKEMREFESESEMTPHSSLPEIQDNPNTETEHTR
jgi:hypothetical protein